MCLLFWVCCYIWFERWLFLPYVLFLGILWDVLKSRHSICMCCQWTWCCPCSCSIIYFCIIWFISIFGVLLFSFELGICVCLLLWLNTLFSIPGKSFSKAGRNLPHLNCLVSIWILSSLLICIGFVLSWLSIYSCTFLILPGSAMLMLPTWLQGAILTLLRYYASASHFQAWYMYCDKSLVFAGATCLKLLHFSLIFSAQD